MEDKELIQQLGEEIMKKLLELIKDTKVNKEEIQTLNQTLSIIIHNM